MYGPGAVRASAARLRWLARLAAAAAALALLAGCGDDEETTGEGDAATWAAEANAICGAAVEEAIALPLPGSAGEVAADATARAGILTAVRDDVAALELPDDVDSGLLDAYIAELDADIGQLEGAERRAPQLDESAGQAALELDLDECAALANAIARTP